MAVLVYIFVGLFVSTRGQNAFLPLIVPAQCQDQEYCEGDQITDYPEEHLRDVLHNTHHLQKDLYQTPPDSLEDKVPDTQSRLRPGFADSIITDSTEDILTEISVRINLPDEYLETPACDTITSFVFPRTARNRDKEWRFVINVPGNDDKENFIQAVRVEKCLQSESECNLATWESTVCRQKYSFKRLLAISGTGEQYVDSFRFPSGCACFQQPVFYTSLQKNEPDKRARIDWDQEMHYNKSSPLVAAPDTVFIIKEDKQPTADFVVGFNEDKQPRSGRKKRRGRN